MSMRIGLLLVGAGFLLALAGAGTSDMEIAVGGNVRFFTGVPLAVLGICVLATGAYLLAPPRRG